MPVTQRMTAEEYLALPESPELRQAELVEGELIVHVPKPLHQLVLGRLYVALHAWSDAGPARGTVWLPLDVHIDDRNVFAPDLLWYAGDTASMLRARWPYWLPRLAIQIRSPSTWRYDVGAKKATYERAGLPELWLVDTAASEVLIFRRSAAKPPSFDVALELERSDTLTSPLLEGFELPLGGLFPPLE